MPALLPQREQLEHCWQKSASVGPWAVPHWVCCEWRPCVARARKKSIVPDSACLFFCFHVLWKRPGHAALFVPPFQRWRGLCPDFEWSITPPGPFEDCCRMVCVCKVPSLVVHRNPFASEALICLNSFSVVGHLIKIKAVSVYVLHATGNTILLYISGSVQEYHRVFKSSWIRSCVSADAAYFWLDHKLRELRVLESHADGFASMEKRHFLEASITPIHDGQGVNSAALFHYPAEYHVFHFLTDIFLSLFYRLISFVSLYRTNLDGWDALGMYYVE